MKHLQFEGKYKDLIKSGKKRLTVRIQKPKLHPGDIVIFHAGGKAIGKFKIKRIYTKKLYQITDEEAKLDGFKSKDQMIRSIKLHYPRIKDNKEVVLIEFEPVEIFEEEVSSEDLAWKGVKIDPKMLAELALKYDDSLTDKQKLYLKLIIECGSLRKAAMKLGNLKKRGILRKILRKSLERLVEKGVITYPK